MICICFLIMNSWYSVIDSFVVIVVIGVFIVFKYIINGIFKIMLIIVLIIIDFVYLEICFVGIIYCCLIMLF